MIVSDIRIRTDETPMLAQARQLNIPIPDGIPMVVNQGIAVFWWLYEKKLVEYGIGLVDVENAKLRSEIVDRKRIFNRTLKTSSFYFL